MGSKADTPTTAVEALLAFLTEKNEHVDVELKGIDDETTVPACKIVLSASSPIFRTMSGGSFSEATSKVIETGFECVVLKWLVEFCCTVKISDFARERPTKEICLQDTLCLLDAANYYHIEPLENYVVARIKNIMQEDPVVATDLLVRETPAAKLYDAALEVIRSEPDKALFSAKSDISLLSADSVERIVGDGRIHATELSIFKIILAWANRDDEKDGEDNGPTSS